MTGNRIEVIAVLMASAAGALAAVPASASDRQAYQFDLPAQDLGDALRAIAAKAGWELYASADDVNGVAVPSLHGRLTARQAIARLLSGTSLRARFDKKAVIIRRSGRRLRMRPTLTLSSPAAGSTALRRRHQSP